MNRKKIYIISIVIVIVALSFGVYFFYKNKPVNNVPEIKVPTEQEKTTILENLSKESTNNFTDQQKNDILKNLSSQKVAPLTEEQKKVLLQFSSKAQ